MQIDPAEDNREDKLLEWERQSFLHARKTVEEYVKTLNANIYRNRRVDEDLLTVPKILRDYQRALFKIYSAWEGKSGTGEGKGNE